jgi:hypothetical protein
LGGESAFFRLFILRVLADGDAPLVQPSILSRSLTPLAQYALSTTPSSSSLNPSIAHFWIDYPHNHLSGPMKWYCLSQIAYWLQQRWCVLFLMNFYILFHCQILLSPSLCASVFRCVHPPGAHRRRDPFTPCASSPFLIQSRRLERACLRPSTGMHRLAGGMRMRGVCRPPVAHSRFVAEFGMLLIRSVRSRCACL